MLRASLFARILIQNPKICGRDIEGHVCDGAFRAPRGAMTNDELRKENYETILANTQGECKADNARGAGESIDIFRDWLLELHAERQDANHGCICSWSSGDSNHNANIARYRKRRQRYEHSESGQPGRSKDGVLIYDYD